MSRTSHMLEARCATEGCEEQGFLEFVTATSRERWETSGQTWLCDRCTALAEQANHERAEQTNRARAEFAQEDPFAIPRETHPAAELGAGYADVARLRLLTGLSEWEQGFADSISRRVASGGELSEKQWDIVKRIVKRRGSQ